MAGYSVYARSVSLGSLFLIIILFVVVFLSFVEFTLDFVVHDFLFPFLFFTGLSYAFDVRRGNILQLLALLLLPRHICVRFLCL